ncbi:MAG: hypothetical protein AAGC55_14280 [Myxococcota bacterium]
MAACGSDSDQDSTDDTSPWEDYNIEPPSDEIVAQLSAPFWPVEQECVPASSVANLPESAILSTDEDGTMQLCVWNSFNGTAPEGMRFNEVASCATPLTHGPSWFTQPTQLYTSDDALLEDEAYVAELNWVQSQIESSGCGCCHASALGSGNTSGFDVSAPAVWTDTMSNARLAMAAGMFEDHLLFGLFPPEMNHGFDRQQTIFPSTDPARMKAFFTSEFERRNGNDDDLAHGQDQFDRQFGRLFDPPRDCMSSIEGIEDGRILWDGQPVRQIYVQEEGSNSPGFPPNLDRPAGTVWALYVDPDSQPLEAGTVAIGEVPVGTRQMIPEDGTAPALVSGQTYRLYAAPDIMRASALNCTFVYQAPEDE